jgi:parallel beta-helix repeat protein
MNRFLANVLGGGVARRSSKNTRRLRIDSLEDRSVPAIITVTNANDNGAGSFRQAVIDANATTDADTIVFDTAGVFATPQTINLETALPDIVAGGGALTITGTGVNNLTIRRSATAATTFRVFTSTAGTANPLTMTDFTVSGGSTASGAGLNATGTVFLDRMRITGNSTTAAGGGILINADGFLSVKNSTISGNTATTTGGGIYFFDSGSLVVENSTISGNTAGGNGGGGFYFYGVASATPPAGFTPDTLVIKNSTIAGNNSTLGGAVNLRGPAASGFVGELLVQNSTITRNTAISGGGGIANSRGGAGVITVQNSIVAGNTNAASPNLMTTGLSTASLNFSAVDNLAGFTLADTSGNNVTGSFASFNLGPLQDNGGPTQTIIPGAGPLTDAGSNGLVPAGLTTDQRGAGFARILGGTVDIGAVESIPADNPFAVATTTTVAGGSTYQFTVTYTDLAGANPGLDVGSIQDNDSAVRVTGPNGFNALATFVSIDVASDGSPRTATYEIAAPGGTFDVADNGVYTVSVEAGQVLDLNGNPVVPTNLGTFTVAVPVALTVTTDADAGAGSLRDAITQANASVEPNVISFDPGFFNTANPRTISLLTALPQFTVAGGGLTITGPGRDFLTVQRDPGAAAAFRIIDSLAPSLELTGFTITGGTGTSVGGALTQGTTRFDDMAIVGNAATTASVGGVYIANGQSIVIANSVISNNTAANIGGGIWVGVGSTLTLLNSTVADNSGVAQGGGVFVNNGGSVTIIGSTITGNQTTGTAAGNGGGGITVNPGARATVIDSTVSDNTAAGVGGGISMRANSALTVQDSTISGNTGTVGGGVYFAYNGSFTLENSTVSGNTATTTTAGIGGGGVYFYGNATEMRIRNSTIANNTSANSGGGIQLSYFYGTLEVENTTIVGNSAAATGAGTGGGGFALLGGGTGTIDLVNSIVAGNTNTNGPDILSPVADTITVSFSALSSTTGFDFDPTSPGVIVDDVANLGLGALADNGGPTLTIGLLAGSPLIDTGDDAAVTATTDQIGGSHERLFGDHVDIGSYEVQPPEVTVEQAAGQPDPVATGPILFDINFDVPVTDFTVDDVTVGGTYTGAFTANLIAVSATSYQLEITGLDAGAEGTIEVSVAADVATDNTGVGNAASTSTDGSVTYDDVDPGVTIDQGAGQPDATNAFPIVFDVVFDEDVTGFDFSDVTFTLGAGLTGTPVGTVTQLTPSTYTVTVTGGIAGVGTLTASIDAGAATDAAGNDNAASTSTDGSVDFDEVAPTVTIDPTIVAPAVGGTSVSFDVVFSEAVVGLTGASFDTTGSTATGTLTVNVTGTGPAYVVTVTGMTSGGTVVLNLADGAVTDPAGNDVVGDNSSVTFVNTGTLQFSAPTYSITEQGSPTLTVTVTRVVGAGTAEGSLSVDYATVVGGTATAGADYTAATGTLTFGPTDTSLTFTVPVIDDALLEGDETVNLALTNISVPGGLGTQSTAVATITDFEEGGFTFDAPTYSVLEGGTATITINRVGGSGTTATVDYGLVVGSAELTDIGTPSIAAGTLNWAIGETSKTITIPVVDDALSEGNETINLSLANPTGGAGLGANTASVLTLAKSDPIVIGAAQKFQYKTTDTDQDGITVKLTGTKLGTMDVYLTDNAGPVSVIDIAPEVDAAKTTLSVAVAKAKKTVNPTADGLSSIEEINGAGLKSISAAKASLIGAGINMTGYVGSVTLANVSNGADIITGGTSTQKTKVTLGVVGNGTDVTTGAILNGLTATAFGDGAITAPSATTIQIKGNAKASVAGNFGGDLTLDGTGVLAGKATLTNLKVAGSVLATSDIDVTGILKVVSVGTAKGNLDELAGDLEADAVTTITVNGNLTGDITVTGTGVLPGKFALGTLKVVGAKVGAAIVGGTVDGSTITVGGSAAVGNVNSVSAVQFLNSTFLAGYTGPTTGTGAFNVPAAGTVNNFTVTGLADAFANSDVIASTFKKVTLKSVDTTNGADAFGFIAGDAITSLKVTTPVFTFVTADGSKTVDQFTVKVV